MIPINHTLKSDADMSDEMQSLREKVDTLESRVSEVERSLVILPRLERKVDQLLDRDPAAQLAAMATVDTHTGEKVASLEVRVERIEGRLIEAEKSLAKWAIPMLVLIIIIGVLSVGGTISGESAPLIEQVTKAVGGMP